MNVSNADEMTLNQILRDWFWYEPKEETQAARRKFRDEQNRIRKMLNDGIKNGKLQHRVEIKEIKRDVFPNSFTREFDTDFKKGDFDGLPYTRTDSIKTVYIIPQDLTIFLKEVKEKPPEDSPLFKRLVNWWNGRIAIPGQTNEPGETQNRRKRQDNLTRALVSAMQSFGRKPSFDEIWTYFQDYKDETGIIVDFIDDALSWIDTKGKIHDTKIKTVQNRLAKLNYPE